MERARAKKGLVIFFAVVLVGSAAIEAAILASRDPIAKHPGLIAALMWMPALASLVARVALREGPRDVSFRLGGRRGLRLLAVGWLYPFVVGVLAYGLAGDAAAPFRTIAKGASVLAPGDQLLVRAGTYAEQFDNGITGGTSWSLSVTLAAYPGEGECPRPAPR